MGRRALPEDERRRPFGGKMDPALYKRLEARAKAERITVSRLIEKAVAHFLSKTRTPKQ